MHTIRTGKQLVPDSHAKEESQHVPCRPFPMWQRSLAQDLMYRESPDSFDTPKHIVVVMDGHNEFSMAPVEWVLKNIALRPCCTITLLGVTPWLNLPHIWTMDLQDTRHSKVQKLVELCQKYGVMPQLRTRMGFPEELLVAEQIMSLHATLVVFDRHHRKYREYYAEKLPCNMVVMGDNGEVELIKCRSHFTDDGESCCGESSSSLAPTPELMIAEHLEKVLRQKSNNSDRPAESSKKAGSTWKGPLLGALAKSRTSHAAGDKKWFNYQDNPFTQMVSKLRLH